MATSSGDLFRLLSRLGTERVALADTLNLLTTGNSGVLHEMKLILNSNGTNENAYSQAVGGVGGEVYQLSNNMLKYLDSVIDTMNKKLHESQEVTKQAIQESESVKNAINYVNQLYSNKNN